MQETATKLRFNNGKFKIVQFTDIHWIPGKKASLSAAECMSFILDEETPDLIIITGDIIYGGPAGQCLEEALRPITDRSIPFAVTFGNHDDEYDMTREELYEKIASLPGSVTGKTEGLTGITNYCLEVLASGNDNPAACLYIFDSNTYSTLKKIKGYGWIAPDQINWYNMLSRKHTLLNAGKPLNSLAFFHIPLPEYSEAGSKGKLIGYRGEKECSPKLNTGLFANFRINKDVKGVFTGHDHNNDYCAEWKEIALCYGRYSGGNTVYNKIPGGNGARIIEIKEGKKGFKTWIRLRNGEKLTTFAFR